MDLDLSGNFDEWPRLIGGVAVLLTLILNPEGVAGAAAHLPGRRLIEGLLRRHRGSAMAARAAGGGAAPERPAAPELTAGKRSASLEVEEVTVSFGGVRALHDVTLAVRPGELASRLADIEDSYLGRSGARGPGQ